MYIQVNYFTIFHHCIWERDKQRDRARGRQGERQRVGVKKRGRRWHKQVFLVTITQLLNLKLKTYTPNMGGRCTFGDRRLSPESCFKVTFGGDQKERSRNRSFNRCEQLYPLIIFQFRKYSIFELINQSRLLFGSVERICYCVRMQLNWFLGWKCTNYDKWFSGQLLARWEGASVSYQRSRTLPSASLSCQKFLFIFQFTSGKQVLHNRKRSFGEL